MLSFLVHEVAESGEFSASRGAVENAVSVHDGIATKNVLLKHKSELNLTLRWKEAKRLTIVCWR